MKKSATILAMTVLALFMAMIPASCKQSPDRVLDDNIKELQRHLPQNAGNGMMITGIDREGSYVVYTVEFNEAVFTLSDLKKTPDADKLMKEAILADLQKNADDANFAKTVKLLKDAGVGMKYVICGKRSADQFVVTIQPDELP